MSVVSMIWFSVFILELGNCCTYLWLTTVGLFLYCILYIYSVCVYTPSEVLSPIHLQWIKLVVKTALVNRWTRSRNVFLWHDDEFDFVWIVQLLQMISMAAIWSKNTEMSKPTKVLIHVLIYVKLIHKECVFVCYKECSIHYHDNANFSLYKCHCCAIFIKLVMFI